MENYKENDDLMLYMTIIESVTINFNPTRNLIFSIVKPINYIEKPLKWNSGTLFFKNIYFTDLELINEFYEYPEFYRSAIISNSELLNKTIQKLNRLQKEYGSKLIHYYLYTLQGDMEIEFNIICESHEFILNDEAKPLEEFKGFDE
ncbi:hypothetical protein LFX15_18725 [Leptospira levettii]|uniref:hypothetical protein n=1 Tax=Leptospira levettii TaxID=2023178 RepID=UPI001EE9E18E|nr:hypothetical protein [Leptospira levettii]MCG6150339.1 hypothetical protein [Leptospira levettii]